jgi:hypothetical protein
MAKTSRRKTSRKSPRRKTSRKSPRRKTSRKSPRRKTSRKSPRRKTSRKSPRRKTSRKKTQKFKVESYSGCPNYAKYGKTGSQRSKYSSRPGPPFPANHERCKGLIMQGNNGRIYKSKKTATGAYRWVVHI